MNVTKWCFNLCTRELVFKNDGSWAWLCVILLSRYESAAASFKVCLQSYLSSDLPAADNSRESSPLHTMSSRPAKVTLLHKNQEPSSRDANVVSYIVQQVSYTVVLFLGIIWMLRKDVAAA